MSAPATFARACTTPPLGRAAAQATRFAALAERLGAVRAGTPTCPGDDVPSLFYLHRPERSV